VLLSAEPRREREARSLKVDNSDRFMRSSLRPSCCYTTRAVRCFAAMPEARYRYRIPSGCIVQLELGDITKYQVPFPVMDRSSSLPRRERLTRLC
jgi:hypothetical protein